MNSGLRAAYLRIVTACYYGGPDPARAIIADLRLEARHEMLGIVCFELDHRYAAGADVWPLEMVKRLLTENSDAN
jgi:hypothetical protein